MHLPALTILLATISGAPLQTVVTKTPIYGKGTAQDPVRVAGLDSSGNATTATALKANGSNCGSGQAALGVDAQGNSEGCWTPLAAEDDPQVSYLGTGKWCTSDGATVACLANAPVLSEADPTVNALGKAELTCASSSYVPVWGGSTWTCAAVPVPIATESALGGLKGLGTGQGTLCSAAAMTGWDAAGQMVCSNTFSSIASEWPGGSACLTDEAPIWDSTLDSGRGGWACGTVPVLGVHDCDPGNVPVWSGSAWSCTSNRGSWREADRKLGHCQPITESATAFGCNGITVPAVTGTAAAAQDDARNYIRFATGTSLNDTAGHTAATTQTWPGWRPIYYARVKTKSESVNSLREWHGLTSASLASTAVRDNTTGSGSITFVAIGWDTSVSEYMQCCSGDGSGTYSCARISVAVAPDTEYSLILDWATEGKLYCHVNAESVTRYGYLSTAGTALAIQNVVVNRYAGNSASFRLAHFELEQN